MLTWNKKVQKDQAGNLLSESYKAQGELVEVSKEVYLTYYRMNRKARVVVEKDQRNGTVLFSDLDMKELYRKLQGRSQAGSPVPFGAGLEDRRQGNF